MCRLSWETSPRLKVTSSNHSLDQRRSAYKRVCSVTTSFPGSFRFPPFWKTRRPGNEVGLVTQLADRYSLSVFNIIFSPKNSFLEICPSLSLSCFLRLSSMVNCDILALSCRTNKNHQPLEFAISRYFYSAPGVRIVESGAKSGERRKRRGAWGEGAKKIHAFPTINSFI